MTKVSSVCIPTHAHKGLCYGNAYQTSEAFRGIEWYTFSTKRGNHLDPVRSNRFSGIFSKLEVPVLGKGMIRSPYILIVSADKIW